MEHAEVINSLRYAIAESETGEIMLTVFEGDCSATIYLGKCMAEQLVENLNRYIQALK